MDRQTERSAGLSIGVVVVHYAFPEGAASVVRSLQTLIPEPAEIVVVDNDSPLSDWMRLRDLAPMATLIRAEANRGYAAAVNAGVRKLQRVDFVIVATHDVLLRSRELDVLIRHFADPRVVCVAPMLVLRGSDLVWSAGGTLSASGRPGHLGHGESVANWASRSARAVAWADGAFLIYRYDVLCDEPLDEEFFLYMEELEHHCRLAARGLGVVLEPAFQVEQQPSGVPPYLLGRNTRLLQRKLHRGGYGLLANTRLWMTEVAAFAAGRRSRKAMRLFVHGWLHPGAPIPVDWGYRDRNAA